MSQEFMGQSKSLQFHRARLCLTPDRPRDLGQAKQKSLLVENRRTTPDAHIPPRLWRLSLTK